MAKNKSQQEFVKEITPRSVDFAQWYTDVILKTDLVDYEIGRASCRERV